MGALFFKNKKEQIGKISKSFFELSAKDIDGQLINFSTFQTYKAIIVVNVASSCGLTKSNYRELNELYEKYHAAGLEILAFPCNQFMSQESKCDVDIKEMVRKSYKAQFPIFAKTNVNGTDCHEVYKFLRNNSELYDSKTDSAKEIPWNFGKFLINNKGEIVKFYNPEVKPITIAPEIEKLINQA